MLDQKALPRVEEDEMLIDGSAGDCTDDFGEIVKT